MTKEELANLTGEFTSNYTGLFFISTKLGRFIWSNPDYNGDGSLRETTKTLHEFCVENGEQTRQKGVHNIGRYCGRFNYVEV